MEAVLIFGLVVVAVVAAVAATLLFLLKKSGPNDNLFSEPK